MDLIAPGDVDERSIEDVTPAELAKYTQCHFFAGIGVWSYALRLAGWPDDRPVWTGSCPCQPFSQAGKGAGTSDERHLWPSWEHLVRECLPAVLFGEQVASPAAALWTDLVQDDLEALDYAFGAVAFPAASVGAPHIRDRQYWMAHNNNNTGRIEHAQRDGEQIAGCEAPPFGDNAGGCGGLGGMADRAEQGRQPRRRQPDKGDGTGPSRLEPGRLCDAGDGRADSSSSTRLEELGEQSARSQCAATERGGTASKRGHAGLPEETRQRSHSREMVSIPEAEGPHVSSAWSDVEWVYCRDNKWRPVEPGSFPLAHGAPARVGRLRGYGNAIVSEAAKIFIQESGLLE